MQKQHDAESPSQLTVRLWGRNISQARIASGLTQEELGSMFEPVPVHQSTVARWESGKIEPSLDHKLALARHLARPAATLFPLPTIIEAA
ncbi:MAG: helix-turn-helix transcriptional regulator [Actinomycetota bacterium]